MEKETSMETKVSWRPAQEEDAAFARRAHHEAYHDVVVKQFGNWDEAVADTFFESEWEGSEHEILLANDQPCGYFSVSESEDCITLNELVLLPEFQGKGIGSRVLDEVIAMAKAKNIPARLEVLKKNKAAELYRRKGFRQTGETETHFQMEYGPL